MNSIKFAYIAFQKLNNEEVNIFYCLGYSEIPIEVDLEDFVAEVKTNEQIGLIGQGFEVALLKQDEARQVEKLF
jgi:hypothetical protein